MIENKQFYTDCNYVMQNSQVYVVCGDEHSADVVVTALNELFKKNNDLKQEVSDYRCKWLSLHQDNECLIEENTVLKQQLGIIDQLIDDLGSDEMYRKYTMIIGNNGVNDDGKNE